jgi:hypothetical protein
MTWAVRAWRDAKGVAGITIGTVEPIGMNNYVAEIDLEEGEVDAFLSQCAEALQRARTSSGVLREPLPGPYDRWDTDV